MWTSNHILSTLAVLSIISPCQAQNNTKVQLDLIFPRSNTVYKPIYPFPIVFMIHNAALLWPFGTKFRWRLLENGINRFSDKLEPQWQVIDNGGYTPTETIRTPTDGRGAPPPSPFLFVNSSKTIIKTNATAFKLQYSFGLWKNCSDMIAESEANLTATRPTYTIDGEMFFNISRDNGEIPNILGGEGGDCATPLGAIGVLGSNGSEFGFPCPVRQKPPPEPDLCKFKVSPPIASEVADAMIRETHCKAKTWPNVTGPCKGKDSIFGSATIASPAKFAVLAGALGFGIILILASS
jgi:hypothetical protein